MRHLHVCLAFASCIPSPTAFHQRHRNVITDDYELRELLGYRNSNRGKYWDQAPNVCRFTRYILGPPRNSIHQDKPVPRYRSCMLTLMTRCEAQHGDAQSPLGRPYVIEEAMMKMLRFCKSVSILHLMVMYSCLQMNCLRKVRILSYTFLNPIFAGNDRSAQFPFGDANLIAKALKKARRNNERYMVLTRKRVLPGSGLGGGTADGAFVIKALSTALDPTESLEMGSDHPFLQSDSEYTDPIYVYTVTVDLAVVSGRGEEITPLAPLDYNGLLYILIPDEHVSTAEVFKRARELIHKGEMKLFHFDKEKIISLLKSFNRFKPYNALEACVQNEGVKSLLQSLRQNLGSNQYGMSGSGSACFAIGVNDADVIRVRHDYGRPLMIVKTRIKQPGNNHSIFSYL
uniref:4-diphosphocytidyl-2C-methyl-D-erythritol kinase n=1 Tax=Babesia orientalis TaxID=273649 RepID=A0A346FHM6_9APIC|nr:4-diphosphocytidyl-2C-methyl-D-erythritol kinase [Babesia orientalis]